MKKNHFLQSGLFCKNFMVHYEPITGVDSVTFWDLGTFSHRSLQCLIERGNGSGNLNFITLVDLMQKGATFDDIWYLMNISPGIPFFFLFCFSLCFIWNNHDIFFNFNLVDYIKIPFGNFLLNKLLLSLKEWFYYLFIFIFCYNKSSLTFFLILNFFVCKVVLKNGALSWMVWFEFNISSDIHIFWDSWC